jgi:hypothetical protein
MAGLDARKQQGGGEPVGDRPVLARVRRLTLVLVLVVAGLAAFHPAAATARPLSSATDPMAAERLGGAFASDSGQHDIDHRDSAPPALERRAARGVDSFTPQTQRSDQSLPARWTRLQRRVHAGPPSRAADGNSSRAPPQASGATSPLA